MKITRYENLASLDGSTVVVVIRPPDREGDLECDGRPMAQARPVPCSALLGGFAAAVGQHGSRFRDHESGLEIFCVRGSFNKLTYSGHRLIRSGK